MAILSDILHDLHFHTFSLKLQSENARTYSVYLQKSMSNLDLLTNFQNSVILTQSEISTSIILNPV